MFYLADIFEEIIDRFDHSPLAKQEFILKRDELIFHIFS